MVRLRLLVPLAIIVVASLAPASAAADGKVWVFSEQTHSAIADALALKESYETTATVLLESGKNVTWAGNELFAPVSVTGGTFTSDLYFTTYGGFVTVEYGHMWTDKTFEKLGVARVPIASETRLVEPLKTPVDIGHAHAEFAVHGTTPIGAYPAIRVTLDGVPQRTMYLDDSVAGAATQSSATVPLPELPALVLLGVGLLTVGGVAVLRTRSRWS